MTTLNIHKKSEKYYIENWTEINELIDRYEMPYLLPVFSKEFRRLSDKTQMFETNITPHFRTRLTHSNEVAVIGQTIYQKLLRQFDKAIERSIEEQKAVLCANQYFYARDVSLYVVKAISLLHDIGHTPFGHIGEYVLDEILDDEKLLYGIRFKHNVNSFRILMEEFFTNNMNSIANLKILDGVLKHTSIYPKRNPIDPKKVQDAYLLNLEFSRYLNEPQKVYLERRVDDYLDKFGIKIGNKELLDKYFSTKSPFFIEGQIVKVSDEVSQRLSDLDDSIRLMKMIFKEDEDEITQLIDIIVNKLKILVTIIFLDKNKKEPILGHINKIKEPKDVDKIVDFMFNDSSKMYCDMTLKSYKDAKLALGEYSIKYVEFLIKKLEVIKSLLIEDRKGNNVQINNIAKSISKKTKKYYIDDISFQFGRTIMEDKVYRRKTVLPLYKLGKNKYVDFIQFSNYGLLVAEVLSEINKKYFIKSEKKKSIYRSITDSNEKGEKRIRRLYNYFYLNPNELPQSSKKHLWLILKDYLRELNHENNEELSSIQLVIDKKDYDALKKIMKDIRTLSIARERISRKSKPLLILERKYSFVIAYSIAAMNNRYVEKSLSKI